MYPTLISGTVSEQSKQTRRHLGTAAKKYLVAKIIHPRVVPSHPLHPRTGNSQLGKSRHICRLDFLVSNQGKEGEIQAD